MPANKGSELSDILLNKTDNHHLYLRDDTQKIHHLKQVATIKIGQRLYCLLAPISKTEKCTGAYVFRVDERDLLVLESPSTSRIIFNAYLRAKRERCVR